MTATTMQVLGANDEQTTCDLCGKIELHTTVIIGDADRVEVGRYGTTCAGYMLDPSGKTTVTAKDAKLIEAVRRDHVYWQLRRARAALDRGEHLEACRVVTLLERSTFLHRADELAAVADVRERARDIRAQRRAAGLPVC